MDHRDDFGGGAILTNHRYELVPISGIFSAAESLPRGSSVTVTCSPRLGQTHTIEIAEALAASGLDVVPHLAARQIHNKIDLQRIVERLTGAGITDVFVVGGDGAGTGGEFRSALQVLEELCRIDHSFRRIGVAAYPEGHYVADYQSLTDALASKQAYATYMVTQMCFDADVIYHWLYGVRERGVQLPCYVGIPGPVDRRKLARVSLRIGVGDSLRYVRGNWQNVRGLIPAKGYEPDELLQPLLQRAGEESVAGISGLHIYTFNETEASVGWMKEAIIRWAAYVDGSPDAASPTGTEDSNLGMER